MLCNIYFEMVKTNYKIIYRTCGLFLLIMVVISSLSFSSADNDIITFEANIIADSTEEPTIRISVPDYINLGNVSVGGKSQEIRVFINNTGSVDVIVTPELMNSSEEIFSYLYFREQKTRTINGTSTNVPFSRLGNFSFSAAKPTSGNDFNEEDFYTILDLTDFNGNLNNNLIGHRANVKFIAVEE